QIEPHELVGRELRVDSADDVRQLIWIRAVGVVWNDDASLRTWRDRLPRQVNVVVVRRVVGLVHVARAGERGIVEKGVRRNGVWFVQQTKDRLRGRVVERIEQRCTC